MMRKIFFNTALAVLLLLMFEAVATGYYAVRNGHFASRTAAEKEREQTFKGMTGISPGNLEDIQRARWENTLSLHPFFGYTQNPKLPGVNNYGFQTPYDFELCGERYCLKPDGGERFVVGIFGGSFAALTAQEGAYLENKLKQAGISNAVIVNFAFGGHALPQSFYIFEHFRELINAAVFIDGVNEVWNFVENNKGGGPPEYAKVAHYKYKLSVSEMSQKNFNNTLKIMAVNQAYLIMIRMSLLPVLEKSLAVHAAFRIFTKAKARFITQNMTEIERGYYGAKKFHDVSDEAMLRFAAQRWEEYHRFIHEIGMKRGILTLHFLQPNSYLEGTKILTASERALISRPPPAKDYIRSGYPLLREKLSKLTALGLIGNDLSSVFQNVKEDIWVDPYHANAKGSQMILDEIFNSLRDETSILKS